MSWEGRIAQLARIKQAIAEVDRSGLWPWSLPGGRADETRLARAEQNLGLALDGVHRTFLSHADGWRGLHQFSDLLACHELGGGARRGRAEELVVRADEEGVLAELGLAEASVLPVAVSRHDLDVFVMPVASARVQAPVLWLAGTLVEVFPDFSSFFDEMVRANLAVLETAQVGQMS